MTDDTKSRKSEVDSNKPLAMMTAGELKTLFNNELDERLLLLDGAKPANDALLDRAGAAKYLGVSLPQLDKLCREKALPFHRVGDCKRFDRDEVRGWVRAQAAR